MASNDRAWERNVFSRLVALTAVSAAALLVAGCSVMGPRESPLNDATRGSPTVTDIYRGRVDLGDQRPAPKESARDVLRRQSPARPIAQGDGDTQRYWSALQPMQQRFARVPNPDLVMVVFPHLARGNYPIPGYVTVFPMYEQTQYALPGEVEQDLLKGRSRFATGGRGQ